MKPKKLPDREEPRVGGPFDGTIEYFTPEYWGPNQTRYAKLHERGEIEDTTVFSKDFPEGAIYRWDENDRVWKYMGLPSEESQREHMRLFKAFGVKPREPL